jgi:hypothetical protein
MWRESLSFAKAYKEVLARRPWVRPNPGFERQLRVFERLGSNPHAWRSWRQHQLELWALGVSSGGAAAAAAAGEPPRQLSLTGAQSNNTVAATGGSCEGGASSLHDLLLLPSSSAAGSLNSAPHIMDEKGHGVAAVVTEGAEQGAKQAEEEGEPLSNTPPERPPNPAPPARPAAPVFARVRNLSREMYAPSPHTPRSPGLFAGNYSLVTEFYD